MLLNIDYGLIKTVGEVFKDNDELDYNIYSYTENQIVYLLLNRILDDPLSLVIKSHNMDLTEDIYNQFTRKVLNNSIYTNIINMIISTSNVSALRVTVYCKNKIEEQFIRERLYPLNTNIGYITADNFSDIDLDDYSGIYVNKISELYSISENVAPEHQIYLLKSKYNLIRDEENEYVLPESIYENIHEAQLNLVVPYIIDDSYLVSK